MKRTRMTQDQYVELMIQIEKEKCKADFFEGLVAGLCDGGLLDQELVGTLRRDIGEALLAEMDRKGKDGQIADVKERVCALVVEALARIKSEFVAQAQRHA